jgi:riboflavin synthase
MFTGLIESVGTIARVEAADGGTARRVRIAAPCATGLEAGDSVAVNGVCLTVAQADGDAFEAVISPETLRVTTFRGVEPGRAVNLERALAANGRLGGHFVLGHVDEVGRVADLRPEGDCWWLSIDLPPALVPYVVPKGSIAIDGISLTVASLEGARVGIQIVPFTFDHTAVRGLRRGDPVNIETDVLGKYAVHLLARRGVPMGDA